MMLTLYLDENNLLDDSLNGLEHKEDRLSQTVRTLDESNRLQHGLLVTIRRAVEVADTYVSTKSDDETQI